MQIAARIGTMARRGAPLPYLRRVAYLESHGTEYIDTGIRPSSLDGNILSIRAAYTGINEVGCLYGAVSDKYESGTVNNCFYQLNKTTTTNQFRIITFDGDIFYSLPDFSTMNDYEVRGNTLSINGSDVVVGRGKGDILRNLVLFARSTSNGTVNQFGKWRVESCSYSNHDVVLFDYIPVLDLSGRPAMYDEVSGQFFYNQGTGDDFEWGEL